MLRKPIQRTISLNGDWQQVSAVSIEVSNVDLIASPRNNGDVRLRTKGREEYIDLIASQIQDYAKDGVSRIDLASLEVRGGVGDILQVKGEA